MIKHVVLFKTKENAPLEIFKEKIENLKNDIPEIINIQVGIDIKFDPNSSDFCVITDVKNINDLEIYAKHPKHLEVISYIKPYIIERKVVDFKV
ncbi:stress responsive A/B Barrel Domain superfamily [Nautilia profundicola AmH]|uniref:Stress responsive A/B Barrel Domain superfamily n=1 Tax=Nautilia profundicola (strain ATCC BAA-1463 / DSM 18972 / AmH) TaxID=598659 RepID=B9L9B6_NAUPA|nr:Dabb family protein [Nautilia profundicola]ACM92287.1 stress responsive A/B Barrel Domain superfamily [Nautilia profundicola AmH]